MSTQCRVMTIPELQALLDAIPINHARYSLSGNASPDALVLNHQGAWWSVCYVDERGGKHPMGRFATEDLACHFLYQEFLESERISTQFGLNR